MEISFYTRYVGLDKKEADARLKSLIQYADAFSPDKTADSTKELLKKVIERLDRIEKRLEAMEKKNKAGK